MTKKKYPASFCPYCNAKGSTQPVLVPMDCREVNQTGVDEQGREGVPAPYVSYTCSRCKYGEIM